MNVHCHHHWEECCQTRCFLLWKVSSTNKWTL